VPTYQYACTECGAELEVVQSFTDAALTECATCGGALRKVYSAVGVVFKGSGFYKTDSRAAAKSSDSSAGGESKTDGGKKGDAASKPETPAKSAPAATGSSSKASTPAASSA
jgi:putative FmdB family regulatory protein